MDRFKVINQDSDNKRQTNTKVDVKHVWSNGVWNSHVSKSIPCDNDGAQSILKDKWFIGCYDILCPEKQDWARKGWAYNGLQVVPLFPQGKLKNAHERPQLRTAILFVSCVGKEEHLVIVISGKLTT